MGEVCLALPHTYDRCLLWAAMTTCFFGFFRSGEITVASGVTFAPAIHLAWGDVAINSEDPPTLRVFLKRSKTDQFGRGVHVYMQATNNQLCPVNAVTTYVAMRGTSSGPFFRWQEGAPLTKAQFVDKVRETMLQAGIPTEGYCGHSFRIGAATEAARSGVPDSTIQSLGHWASGAFLRYIRTPRERLAGTTRALARNYGQRQSQ